jgi:hypothetical protein
MAGSGLGPALRRQNEWLVRVLDHIQPQLGRISTNEVVKRPLFLEIAVCVLIRGLLNLNTLCSRTRLLRFQYYGFYSQRSRLACTAESSRRCWRANPTNKIVHRHTPLNLALGNDKNYFENVLTTDGSMELFSEAMECLKGCWRSIPVIHRQRLPPVSTGPRIPPWISVVEVDTTASPSQKHFQAFAGHRGRPASKRRIRKSNHPE